MDGQADTEALRIAHDAGGPADGTPVVAVPYLRGFGPTRFLDPDRPRSGRIGALGRDLAVSAGCSTDRPDKDRLAEPPPVRVPCTVLHGERDGDNLAGTTEGKETLFTGPYERALLPGIGHFPPREAPGAVGRAVRRLAGDAPAGREHTC